jgi:hypothetical protein
MRTTVVRFIIVKPTEKRIHQNQIGDVSRTMNANYSEMSLIELKKAAKGRRIKQYYIMKRHQLIEVLSMPDLPACMKIEKMTIHEVRDEARRRGMRGFWNLRRDKLVDLLFPQERNVNKTASHENQEDERDANKHDNPEQHNAKEVGVENLENTGNHGFDDMNLD